MLTKPKRIVDPQLLARVRAKKCVACSRGPCDPSHIISRGAGGHDTEWNVAPMCRAHHSLWHQRGVMAFLVDFPIMRLWLESRGWEIHVVTEGGCIQLIHPELR